MFDLQKLTLGEVAKIEELSGQSITSIGEDNTPKGLMLAALAMVVKRREDPSFSWNKAQELTFADASVLVGISTTEDEEEAAAPLDSGSSTSRTKKKS